MADETKKYLVNIESNLNKYAKDAADAKDKVDQLKASNQALKEGGKATATEIEASNAALRNAQKEYKQTQRSLDTLTSATKTGASEREKLNAIVTIETNKLKSLGDGYTKNSKGLLTINPQYVTQKKAVADANKALIDYDLSINKGGTNVGRYAESLGGLVGKFSSIPGPIGATISIINNFSTSIKSTYQSLTQVAPAAEKAKTGINIFKTAILPISIIITAIVGALSLLIKAFKGNDEASEKFSGIMKGIGVVVSEVLGRIVSFGRAVVDLFKGDFKGAAEEAKAAFTGLGQAIKDAYAAGTEQNQLAIKIEDAEIELLEKIAKRNKEIAEIKKNSRDEDASALQRSKDLARAEELEKANLEDQLSIQRDRVKLAELELSATNENQRTDEQRKKVAEERAKLYDLETQSIQAQMGIQKRQLAVEREIEEERKKASDERTKMLQQESKDQISLRLALAKGDAEATKKALKFQYDTEIANSELTNTQKELLHVNYLNAIAELDKEADDKWKTDTAKANDKWKTDTAKANEDKLALDQELYNMRLEDAAGNIELTQQIIDQEYEALKKSDRWKKMSVLEQIKIEREYTKTNKVLSENRIDQKYKEVEALGNAAGAIAQILGEETAAGKGFAVAQALINTFLSAAMTMTDKTIPSTYLRIATMVSVIATGLANVQKILSVNTSGGASVSSSVSSISITAARITAPTAISAGTSILNPSGQISQQTQKAVESSQLTATDIAEAVKGVKIVTTIEDINAKTKSTNKVTSRATI